MKSAGYINLIAHTRYSTSGIKDNQPISDGKIAVVMNGVITQTDPSLWNELFGVQCKTTNDTEIALEHLKLGDNPLTLAGGVENTHCSMAIATLNNKGRIQAYRNGRRPAWYGYDTELEMSVIASTQDIFRRAYQKAVQVQKLKPCKVYEVTSRMLIPKCYVEGINKEDWQE